MLAKQTDVRVFTEIASAIHEAGTLSGIQLGDMPPWLSPAKEWRARDLHKEIERLRRLLRDESAKSIKDALDRFVVSAELACEAGYRVVEIHAAHGYTLSLLLDPAINGRKDEYSPDGMWLEDFCQELRTTVGENVLTAVRLSGVTEIREREHDIGRSVSIWDRMVQSGIDILDLSAGLYSVNRQLIYPKQAKGPAYLDVACALCSTATNPVIVSGAIGSVPKSVEIRKRCSLRMFSTSNRRTTP